MQPAASLASFVRAPIGRYVRGRRFLLGFPTAELQLAIGWGTVTEADAREMADVLRAQHEGLPRHLSLVDLRAVRHVDTTALAVLADVMTSLVPINRAVTVRGAVLRPDGVSGMAVAGFWQVLGAGYETRVFTDVNEAFTWLGFPQGPPPELAELTHLIDVHASALTDKLRATLVASPLLSLDAAARKLGLSGRSLQRALHDDGSSFRHESEVARVRLAQELLRDPERSIKDIASSIGMTPTGFTTCFRRVTGTTPTRWRALD